MTSRHDVSWKRRMLAWLPALGWAGLIFFLSHQPQSAYDRLGLTGELLSAAGHLVVYAGLMATLTLALRRGSNLDGGRILGLAFLLAALYGLTDEFHQSFIPGRKATLIDWIIDLVGAGLVWIALQRRE
jgi:VanZ family protein